jgi:hypothetical protein
MALLRKSDTKNLALYTIANYDDFSFEWPQFGTVLKQVHSSGLILRLTLPHT